MDFLRVLPNTPFPPIRHEASSGPPVPVTRLPRISRDFRPVGHMESITADDSSIQQCYVFPTIAGVRYTVETSHDLTNWTTQDEIYGLGNEYVVTIREFTPPPPPPPGTPPATLSTPAWNASIRMERSSGTDGGTVVSWASLDDQSPVIVRIAGEMAAGWSAVPLFAEHYGAYYFFVWHPQDGVEPPAENPVPGPNDSAMLATLEAHLNAINQEVIDSAIRARNAPEPAPPDPDSRCFWRIKVDWSADTDRDGSPDWAEFEIAARENGVPALTSSPPSGAAAPPPPARGDAFNADTNHDRIPDGDQLDADQDGTSDSHDKDSTDNTYTFPIGPLPRYALFPITGAHPPEVWPDPIQINDQGTVLYANGTWTDGTWQPLAGAAIESNYNVRAARINDHGEIVGVQTTTRMDAQGHTILGNLVYWADRNAQIGILSVNGDHPWVGGLEYDYPGVIGVQFSKDGQLIGYNQEESENGSASLDDTYLWTLPGNNRTPGKVAIPLYEGGMLDASHYWGWNHQSNDNIFQLYVGGNPIPAPGTIQNLHLGPGGEMIASFEPNQDTQVYKDGTWHSSGIYANAIDLSDDGTAIGRTRDGKNAPILLNGIWTDITHSSPGGPSDWHDSTVSLLDTTPGGWVLARQGDYTDYKYSVMLPIKAEGFYVKEFIPGETTTKYVGVDDFSIGSDSPGNAVQDRIWIMAPLGGAAKIVTFTGPVDHGHPLTFSASGIDFGNVGGKGYMSNNPSTMTLHATAAATTGQEILVDLKFDGTDGAQSVSHPLGIKVMKNRIVNVTLYRVTKATPNKADGTPVPNNTADQTPDADALQKYLNDVFHPQVNVTFNVTYAAAPLRVEWDRNPLIPTDSDAGDGILECGERVPSTEQQNILADRPNDRPPSDIDVFFIGTDKFIDGTAWASTLRIENNVGINASWIVGDALDGREMGKLVQTIAHEIGHVLVG